MKTYMQQGNKLKRTALSESDHICGCCDNAEHYIEAGGQLYDDAECPSCGQLCSCKCHRAPEDLERVSDLVPKESDH